jgi:DTW domain-containing protein YfiP
VTDPESCPRCHKPLRLCVCAMITPLPTRTRVLILQHPQEPDKDLGSARLAHLALPNSTLRIGLSWPNLKGALGTPEADITASDWVVLYLGSAQATPDGGPLQIVDKKGQPHPDARVVRSTLKGLVILDGTWSQAKALWWRNAWLLKLRRAILAPPRPSMYGRLRREPRRECLSTIESLGVALTALGEPPSVEEGLRGVFAALLERVRTAKR